MNVVLNLHVRPFSVDGDNTDPGLKSSRDRRCTLHIGNKVSFACVVANNNYVCGTGLAFIPATSSENE